MGATRTKHQHRKTHFVDAEVQRALATRLLTHWTLFVLVSLSLVFLLEWLTEPYRSPLDVLQQCYTSFVPMAISFLALVPVLVYDALKFSNRFAGPAYRIRDVIRGLAAGESREPVRFRTHDFWQVVASDLNRVIERMNSAGNTKSTTGRGGEEDRCS